MDTLGLVKPTVMLQKLSASFWLILFATLSFYSYGTAMMDYFIIYPSRHLVGSDEFVAYHALLERGIVFISVLPFLIITLLNAFLLWKRPAGISVVWLWISLLVLLLDWVSTILLQIPMNLELSEGKNPLLIQQVINTNWARVVLETIQVVLAFALLLQHTRRLHGLAVA